MTNKILLLLVALFVSSAAAQQAPRPTIVSGDVVAVSDSKIDLKTPAGNINVELSANTEFKKLLPSDPRPSSAVAAELGDIKVGDRLAVSGFASEDKSKHAARTVYLMTKDDIAQRNQADAQRWAQRGISGRVASANVDTGQIMMEVRGLMGTQSVTVTPKSGAKIMRYRQDSVQYSEAVPGKLSDIQSGDMIRALGDRSSDGLSFTAEEVVTGAFRTVAGTVKSVNETGTEITITELQTKKDVIVNIGRGSILKRFPPEMAMRMAGMGQPGQAGAARSPGQTPTGGAQGGQQPAAGASGAQGPGGPGRPGMGGGPRGGIDDMFERFPPITATDLNVGDMIAVSSSKGTSEERITAIKLLAGVEPFIRAAQMQQGGGRGGRGGQGSGFSIPGLDGFDFPSN